MTDELNEGNLPPVEPTGNPPEESPPKKSPYEGKTPEELAAILEEKERMIGKQAKEVGDLRAKSSELENKLAFKEQFGPTPEPNPLDTQFGNVEEPTPGTQDEVPPDYWTNPRKYHKQWAAEERQREFEEMQKRDSEIRMNVYKANPVVEQARKETPHVFEDISKKEMDEGIYAWLANKWIHPHQLGDPVAHRRIATWIKGEKTEYTYVPKSSPGSPVPPTVTEHYVGTSPPADAADKTPVELDAFGKKLLQYRPKGMSEEEFLDQVRQEQKDRR